MHEESTHIEQDDMERELQQLLRDEAERRRPDRRRARGNPATDEQDVARGREQLERVL